MLTNPRDMFRGQSRSTNMVLFAVAYLMGALVRGPPFGRTVVIFLKDELSRLRTAKVACCHQMRFLAGKYALKYVCGRGSAPDRAGEITALPQRGSTVSASSAPHL